MPWIISHSALPRVIWSKAPLMEKPAVQTDHRGTLSISTPFSRPFSFSPYPPLFLSIAVSVSLSSVTICFSLCSSLSVILCLSVCLSVPLQPSPSLSFYGYLCVFVALTSCVCFTAVHTTPLQLTPPYIPTNVNVFAPCVIDRPSGRWGGGRCRSPAVLPHDIC